MRNLYIFAGLVGCTILLSELSKRTLYVEEYYFYVLQERFTLGQIHTFLERRESISWMHHFLTPLLLFLKIGSVTVCIAGGLFLFNWHTSLGRVFRVITVAEFVFLFPLMAKLTWFLVLSEDRAPEAIFAFPTFSLLDLYERSEITPLLGYPLSQISIPHLAYLVIIIYGLGKILDRSYSTAFKITVLSYGLGFLLWISVIMFLIATVT